MKFKARVKILPALAALTWVAGCAGLPSSAELDAMTESIVKASFRAAGKPLDEKTAKRIEEANFKAIKWPSDGKFLGDWKQGEAIAQSGRGLTWTDAAKMANGGNCYNCHQISKEEISFGTLGPSLYNYGKLRGVKDPNDPASKAIVEYTWGKIWNSKAYNACSNMPRAGHAGVLTEAQVRHVVALLLDPNSPVNK
jgi:sulfur-oxidizing protein SoxX